MVVAVVSASPLLPQDAQAAKPAAKKERAPQKTYYALKPIAPAPYIAPMKALVRLAELKEKHKGQVNWNELVVLDHHDRGEVISMAPGTKVARHLHPDSPEYWVIQQGRMRFEIEEPPGKFQTIEAGKNDLVFVAERHLHSFEVIGNEPAIRFEIRLPDAGTVYETKPATAPKGYEFYPVTLSTGDNPDEVPNPEGKRDSVFWNLAELDKEHGGKTTWSDLVIRKNRAHANIICGSTSDNRGRGGNPLGHYHADFAEMWIVMRGQQQWTIEGIDKPLVAGEGDIVYAPADRWHNPQPYGEVPSCRLALTPFPAGNHLFVAPDAH